MKNLSPDDWCIWLFPRTTPHISIISSSSSLLLLFSALTCLWRLSLSSSERTQPTLPSPPHTRTRKVTNFWNSRRLEEAQRKKKLMESHDWQAENKVADRNPAQYPSSGPPFIRSKTCAGLSCCLNFRRNFTPWLSPLLELTMTSRGLEHEAEVAFQKPEKNVTLTLAF